MNANPTPNPVSGVQLLTWTRFADLRGANSFRCVRLVEAGGVEFKSQSLTAHVFSALRFADHLTIADLLTFGAGPGP